MKVYDNNEKIVKFLESHLKTIIGTKFDGLNNIDFTMINIEFNTLKYKNSIAKVMEILSSHNLPISLKDEEKEKEKKHFIILYGIRDESSYVLYGDFQSARSQQRIHYVNLMNMNAVEYVISSYNNGSTLTSSPMLIAITRHRKFVAELLNLMEQ